METAMNPTGPLATVAFLALFGACASPSDYGQTVGEAVEACTPGAHARVIEGPLNFRSEPRLGDDVLVGQIPEGASLLVGSEPPREGDGHSWVQVLRGTGSGWVAAGYVACSLPAPCESGSERHGYVKRDDATQANVLQAPDATSATIAIMPFGQRVIVREQEGDFVHVVIPSFDESGASDRRTGYMRVEDLAREAECQPAGLAQKDRIGAVHLLGQYELVRGSSGNNAKNAILGFNRVDGAITANGSVFDYLDYIIPWAADYNGACQSNDDCPVNHVCRRRESEGDTLNDDRCSHYFNGGTNGGGVAWASGVCGTATITHRATLDASLLPLEYTTHNNFPGQYLYPGVDAEVWWYGATRQNYRFLNDSGGDLVIVTGTRIGTEADADAGDASGSRVGKLIVSLQIWGTQEDARYSEYLTAPSSSFSGSNVGAPNDDSCLELVRDLTRIGPQRRESPSFATAGSVDGYPGMASIRRISVTEEATADGQIATTERWHITSCYTSSYSGDPAPVLSHSHPENF
jgi:hypothetical protein